MAYSCCFQKIGWPSLYAAARVTRSTYILPVDHGHAMWNAILMTSSVKSMCQHSNALEWKWNRQLTRPIFSVGGKKNAVWGWDSQYLVTSSMQRRKVLWCAVTISRQKKCTQGMVSDKTSQDFFLVMPVQGPEAGSFRRQFQQITTCCLMFPACDKISRALSLRTVKWVFFIGR